MSDTSKRPISDNLILGINENFPPPRRLYLYRHIFRLLNDNYSFRDSTQEVAIITYYDLLSPLYPFIAIVCKSLRARCF